MKIKRTILIVDDMEINRAILCEMFYKEYDVLEASNGKEALNCIFEKQTQIDIVLLDIVMPELDGFGVLKELHVQGLLEHIPVIMITAENSENVMKKGYALGVADIINKPFNPDIVRRRVKNILALYSRQERLEELVKQQTEALRKQSRQLVDILSNIIEFKNTESGQHILNIRVITRFLLEKLVAGFPEYSLTHNQIEIISEAAAMHDIGKIAVPDVILNKPSKLTKEEFQIMQTHTVKGCEVAEKLRAIRNNEYMDYCLDICRHHHERWDGKGYPDGLKGEEITIWSQAVSLADVYDALTSVRVYKPAFSAEEAIDMIMNGECGTFNPKLLVCLVENAEELKEYIKESTEDDFTYYNSECKVDLGRSDGLENEYMNLSERTLRLLEQERENYRILADLSGDITFDYDIKQDVLVFSEKFYDVFGKDVLIEDATFFLKKTDLIYEEDHLALRKQLSGLSMNSPTCKFDIRLKVSHGMYQYFKVYVNSIWNIGKQGDCYSIMGKLVPNICT